MNRRATNKVKIERRPWTPKYGPLFKGSTLNRQRCGQLQLTAPRHSYETTHWVTIKILYLITLSAPRSVSACLSSIYSRAPRRRLPRLCNRNHHRTRHYRWGHQSRRDVLSAPHLRTTPARVLMQMCIRMPSHMLTHMSMHMFMCTRNCLCAGLCECSYVLVLVRTYSYASSYILFVCMLGRIFIHIYTHMHTYVHPHVHTHIRTLHPQIHSVHTHV